MSDRTFLPPQGTLLAGACLAAIALAGCAAAGDDVDETADSPENVGSVSAAAVSMPVLKKAAFPIGVGFGPTANQTEYTNLKAAGITVTTRPAEAYLSPYDSPAMLSTLDMAATNGVKVAAFDGALWSAIDTGASVATAAGAFHTRYNAKSASKYWWIKDEPGKNIFANIQTAAAKMKSLSSTKRRYVNLYPSDASCTALRGVPAGTPCSYSYASYVSDFMAAAPDVDLVTFDQYPFLADGTTQTNPWFASLENVKKGAGTREWGAVIQGSSYTGRRNPAQHEMMWQAMSALAYGGRMIDFFSWTSSSSPNETVVGFGSSSTDRAQVRTVATKIQAFGQYLTTAAGSVWHADTGRPPGTSARPGIGSSVMLGDVPFYVGEFRVPAQSGKLILIGNRKLNDFGQSATATFFPLSTTGHVWSTSDGTTWTLVNSSALAGQAVTSTVSLNIGDARLFYVN